jgi:hypothetical protein
MNTVNLAVINLLAKDEYEVVVDVYYCYTVFFLFQSVWSLITETAARIPNNTALGPKSTHAF